MREHPENNDNALRNPSVFSEHQSLAHEVEDLEASVHEFPVLAVEAVELRYG